MTHRRDTALNKVADHNQYWKARADQELRWMRSARLHHPKKRDELFTFEDLTPTLETLIGRQIPDPNLAGSIAMAAIRSGYIESTEKWVPTLGEAKNSRRAAQYRWKP